MSQENLEFVRRRFGDFARGELDPDDFDPEFVFDNLNSTFDAAEYRGPDGVRAFLALLGTMWEQVRFEPEEFLPVGEDQVIVPMRGVFVGRDGVETVARSAGIFTVRQGKLAHMKSYQSKAEALEVSGLSE